MTCWTNTEVENKYCPGIMQTDLQDQRKWITQ